jgi:hypothetical protein
MFSLTKMAHESYQDGSWIILDTCKRSFFVYLGTPRLLKWVLFERKYIYIWKKNSYSRYAIWSSKIKPAMILAIFFIAHVACLFLKGRGQSASRIFMTRQSKISLTYDLIMEPRIYWVKRSMDSMLDRVNRR